MFAKIILISIFLTIEMCQATNDPTYSQMFMDTLGLSKYFDSAKPDKYNYLHEYKFDSKVLSENCIKFHDSETVTVDMNQMEGRWDTHLMSVELPFDLQYLIADFNEDENVLHVQFYPKNLKITKTPKNYTDNVKGVYILNDFPRIELLSSEIMLAIDYNSYFVKYSCLELMGMVSGTIHIYLRPEMTEKSKTDSNIFNKIIDSLPKSSLKKVLHLIQTLQHFQDKTFENFGQKNINTFNETVENYLKDEELSDESDEQVFDFLNENCLDFDERELTSDQLSELSATNWTLDYANYNYEKIPFDRISINRRSENSFAVKLYSDDKYLTDSDHYYDPNYDTFWVYTEGRRSQKVYLYLDSDYRITYSCDEKQTNEKLETNEILRFYSSDNTTKPNDLSSYMKLMKTQLDSKTLEKLTDLIQTLIPVNEELMDGIQNPDSKLNENQHQEL